MACKTVKNTAVKIKTNYSTQPGEMSKIQQAYTSEMRKTHRKHTVTHKPCTAHSGGRYNTAMCVTNTRQ